MLEVCQPINAKSLANLILTWSNQAEISVSPMKLQKLVYYCHADFLVITGGPLIDQEFEAWEYGPVLPSLYQEFKVYESKPIKTKALAFDPFSCERREVPLPELGENEQIVRASFEAYARYTASVLSEMSHSELGPWAESLRRFERGSIEGRAIKNDVIFRHHRHPGRRAVH